MNQSLKMNQIIMDKMKKEDKEQLNEIWHGFVFAITIFGLILLFVGITFWYLR